MKESLLVNEFFQKLTERNGKSIAANSKYKSNEIMLKLAKKYDVEVQYKGEGNSQTRDHFWVYEVNGQLYGLGFESYHRPDPNPEYDKTDWLKLEYIGYRRAGSVPSWHPAGPDEWGSAQVYTILGKVTADDIDENVWNFLQDLGWYEESEESKAYRAKNNSFYKDKKATEEEYEKVKSIINVEILESKFPQPEDFESEVYDTYDGDGSWSTTTLDEDIDTEFKIKLSIGHIPLYVGTVYPNLSYGLDYSYIEYEETEEINSIWDNDGNKVSFIELADKVPEGRLRDLYIKYVSKAVTEAVDTYVKENSSDCKLEW